MTPPASSSASCRSWWKRPVTNSPRAVTATASLVNARPSTRQDQMSRTSAVPNTHQPEQIGERQKWDRNYDGPSCCFGIVVDYRKKVICERVRDQNQVDQHHSTDRSGARISFNVLPRHLHVLLFQQSRLCLGKNIPGGGRCDIAKRENVAQNHASQTALIPAFPVPRYNLQVAQHPIPGEPNGRARLRQHRFHSQ
jgi:hypothetical protein